MATYKAPGVSVSITSERANPSLVSTDERILLMGSGQAFPASGSETIRLKNNDLTALQYEGISLGGITVARRSAPTVLLVLNTDYVTSQVTDTYGNKTSYIAKKFTTVADELITLSTSGSTVNLAHANVRRGSVVLTNNAGSTTYVEGVDFYVDYTLGQVTHIPGGTISTPLTNAKIDYDWSTLADDDPLNVNYQWTPSLLYTPQEFSSVASIRSFYGASMSGDVINSPITLAAELMANEEPGASLPRLVCMAVDPSKTGSGSVVESADWTWAFTNVVAQYELDTIIPLVSDSVVWASLGDFINNQRNDYGRFMRAWTGPATGFNILSRASGTSSIAGLSNKYIDVVSPELVPYVNPVTGNEILIPGYYMAAVLAMKEAIRPRWESLTNRVVRSFPTFKGNQMLTDSQKNRLATSGVTVIHNVGSNLVIRDALTTALTPIEDQEPSIVRTLNYLSWDFKAAFETLLSAQTLIADDVAMEAIQSSTEERLTQHVTLGNISGWENVSVAKSTLDKRRFEVKARIIPRYPLKRVEFTFSIP